MYLADFQGGIDVVKDLHADKTRSNRSTKELTISCESLCAGGFLSFFSPLCTETLIFLYGGVMVRSTRKEKGSQHLVRIIILPLHLPPYLLELID